MQKYVNILLLFLQLATHLSSVRSEEIYIKARESTTCPGTPCLTLAQYINNPSSSTNVTLVFLSGTHSLGVPFSVTNKVNFSMISSTGDTRPSIVCSTAGRMALSSLQAVRISGVSFSGCGCNTATLIDHFEIRDSSFGESSTVCDGGVWEISRSTHVSIRNSSFSDNVVSERRGAGGALDITDVDDFIVTLCTFTGNQINNGFSGGGALYISQSNSTINMSTFTSNRVNGSFGKGGAVYISATNSTIIDSTFTGNQINGSHSEGGAVYIDRSTSTIFQSTFTANKINGSFGEGGAIYTTRSTSIIGKCAFANNQASGSFGRGSAVYIDRTNSDIFESIFTANQANGSHGEGGAVRVDRSNSTINESTFTGNQINGSFGEGGAVNVARSNSTINKCTFTNNRANDSFGSGGAVYISETNSTITESTFTSNQANSSFGEGGAVHVQVNNIRNTTFSGCTFTRNNAFEEGGALYIRASRNVTVFNCTFTDNSAPDRRSEGGAVYMEMRSNLSYVDFRQCSFLNNRADRNGGAVYANSRFGGVMSFNHCQFSESQGGTIYGNNMTKISVHECSFSNNLNTAALVCAWPSRNAGIGEIIVNRSTFTRNFGAIDCTNIWKINIMSSNFTNHVGDRRMIEVAGRSPSNNTEAVINNCVFSNSEGGVIHSTSSNMSLSISLSTFRNNTVNAREDGIIDVSGMKSSLTISHSTFSKNSAPSCGVVSLGQSANSRQEQTFTATNERRVSFILSVFSHNTATGQYPGSGDGGVACVSNALITVIDSNFKHNSANFNGGVFSVKNGALVIERSTFSNNSAVNSGGVGQISDSVTQVRDSSFDNNRASHVGGVLAVENGNITVENGTFLDNEARSNGAVLYLYSTLKDRITLQVSSSQFSNNKALSSGGILYAENSTLVATFERNRFSFANGTEEGTFAALLNSSLFITQRCNETDGALDSSFHACSSEVLFQGSSEEESDCRPLRSNCTSCCFTDSTTAATYTMELPVDESGVSSTATAAVIASSICGIVVVLLVVLMLVVGITLVVRKRARNKHLSDIINKESISKGEMDNDYEPVCVPSSTLTNEMTGTYPTAMLRGGEQKDVSIELTENVAYRHIDRPNIDMTANVAYGNFTTLHSN